MRRLAAVIVIVVFASLNAMDGICCPDGCTREDSSSTSHDSHANSGLCSLCQGGLQISTGNHFVPIGLIADRVGSAPLMNPRDISPDPPEYPPRF